MEGGRGLWVVLAGVLGIGMAGRASAQTAFEPVQTGTTIAPFLIDNYGQLVGLERAHPYAIALQTHDGPLYFEDDGKGGNALVVQYGGLQEPLKVPTTPEALQIGLADVNDLGHVSGGQISNLVTNASLVRNPFISTSWSYVGGVPSDPLLPPFGADCSAACYDKQQYCPMCCGKNAQGQTVCRDAVAMGLNNYDVSVGMANPLASMSPYSGSNMVAVEWTPTGDHAGAFPTILGSLGGTPSGLTGLQSYAADINDNGAMAGADFAGDGKLHAVRWDADGTIHDLGVPDSYALGIDAAGDVAGNMCAAPTCTISILGPTTSGQYRRQELIKNGGHAFVWTQAGGVTDLGTLGGLESTAYAMNDKGEVVGRAQIADGTWHGFLWLPTSDYGVAAGMHDMNDLLPPIPSPCYIAAVWSVNDGGQMITDGAQYSTCLNTQLLQPTGYVAPPGDPIETSANYPESADDGDPVNTLTGELVARRVDLVLAGPIPLVLARSYGSKVDADGRQSPLGPGWTESYDWVLSTSGTDVTVRTDRGRLVRFTSDGAGGFLPTSPVDVAFQLVTATGTYVLYDGRTGLFRRFDETTGQLLSIEDGHGNAVTVTYDANGRLGAVTDAYGHGLTFSHDASGKLTSVTDGTRTVSYAFTSGYLTQVTAADGAVTTLDYVTGGVGLTDETLPEGNTPYTFGYTPDGKVAVRTDADGNATTFACAPDGTTITDPLGGVRRHTHAADRVLASSTDALGRVTTVGSADGKRTTVTDPLGDVTSYGYDAASGKMASVAFPDGATVAFTYGSHTALGATVYDLTGVTLPGGDTEAFTYDASGNLTQATDEIGGSWSFTYDATGDVLTKTSPTGATTTYTIDAAGNVATIEAGGETVSFTYDDAGRRTGITLPGGATRSVAYDAMGRVTGTTDELGGTTTFAWDTNGRLVGLTDPAGATTGAGYDAMGRLTSLTDAAGNQETFGYDPAGRLTSLTEATGAATALAYDAAGELVSLTDADGNVTSFDHDDAGRLTTQTDALGNQVALTHDARGRVTGITTAGGNAIAYGYDVRGRLTSATDALGETTTYAYDGLSRVTSIHLPDDLLVADYTYDALGDLTSATDAAGNAWTYTYDDLGRLTGRADPDGNATSYARDATGRIATVTTPLGTETRTHDAHGDVVERSFSDGTDLTYAFDADGRLTTSAGIDLAYDARGLVTTSNGLTFTWDAAGRMASVTYATGKTVTYDYDADGLPTQVTDWTGAVTTLGYDADGRLTTITRPNGVTTTYTYDADGGILSVVESGSAPIATTDLTRDAQGQIVSAHRDVPLPPAPPDPAQVFDATKPTFDALGRRTADGTRTYSWDLASRMTGYTEGGKTVGFTYDGLGLPLERTDGSTVTDYVWSYAHDVPSMATMQQGGADVAYYVYLPTGRLLYGVDAQSDAHHFFHFDEMGNTLFLTGDSGDVEASYAYTPFGVMTGHTGTVDNPFTFMGAFGVLQEGSSGLFITRRRVYDARTKRFLSREPAVGPVHPMLLDRYEFAPENPLFYSDPSGAAPGAGVAERTLETIKEPSNILSVTKTVAMKVLDSKAETLTKMAEWAKEAAGPGANGHLSRSVVSHILGLERNAEGLHKLSESLETAGGVAEKLETATKTIETIEKLHEIHEQFHAIVDGNLQTMLEQTKDVNDLVNDKKISVERGQQMIRQILATYQARNDAAWTGHWTGTAIASLTLIKNLVASDLGLGSMVVDIVAPDPKDY